MNPFIVNSSLTPKVSLNRMKFMSLGGGLTADEGLAGKTGLELVSAKTFTQNIENFLRDQNFDTLEDENLNQYIEGIHRDVVRRFARNLAHLLLALKLGDEKNRRARPDWGDPEWSFWRDVERIVLCGGLTQGVLGFEIGKYIEEFFDEMGMTKANAYQIEIPPNSRSLPVIGACRLFGDIYNDNRCKKNGLVFDFGHSYVKKCFAEYTDGLCRIHTLPKSRSEYMELPPDYGLDSAKNLHEFIVEIITESRREVLNNRPGLDISDTIVLSMANYIQNGVPDGTRGGYAKLRLLCQNYETYLADWLNDRLGPTTPNKNIRVKIIHDGMSAAYALDYRSDDKTAVLSLGTGLGIGFPPDRPRGEFEYVME